MVVDDGGCCVSMSVMSATCLSRGCYVSTSVDTLSNTAAAVPALSRGACYMNNLTQSEECCDRECLGGCSGRSAADCFACVHVFHEGRCLERCPRGFYQVSVNF